jgi:protein-tyrosine phosphatase
VSVSAAGKGLILLVCTANICRSPAAELILRDRLIQLGDGQIDVSSAGVRGLAGHSIDQPVADLLVADGIDPESFHARRLTATDAEGADLVLTATTQHRSEVVQLAPAALTRTFTLLEFSRLASVFPSRLAAPAGGAARLRWLRESLLEARALAGLPNMDMDIPDPYGARPRVYRNTYVQIRNALEPIARIVGNRPGSTR